MIDISNKSITERLASASGIIKLNSDAFSSIINLNNKKGDVLNTARIAGIHAAKQTSNLIPLAHNITINSVEVDFELNEASREIYSTVTVKSEGKTGVEIEALTAVQISLMTIYDMCKYLDRAMEITKVRLLTKTGGKSGDYRVNKKVIKKISYFVITIIAGFIFYFSFLFDINDYKKDLESFISKKANIEFEIQGNLNLDLGINTKINAESLSVKKDNILLLESNSFSAIVSLGHIIRGRFDIDSISMTNSKLYGINIDESIVKTYNALKGTSYNIKNNNYSAIRTIEAKGYYENELLNIKDIRISTDLLTASGFGSIKPSTQSLNISAVSYINDDDSIKNKYGKYFPKYLAKTEIPILIFGNYNNPEIDIKISDVIAKKIKEEVKNKAIKSIKDKIKEKIQSDINIKLPF